jgi:hypothetical protein
LKAKEKRRAEGVKSCFSSTVAAASSSFTFPATIAPVSSATCSGDFVSSRVALFSHPSCLSIALLSVLLYLLLPLSRPLFADGQSAYISPDLTEGCISRKRDNSNPLSHLAASWLQFNFLSLLCHACRDPSSFRTTSPTVKLEAYPLKKLNQKARTTTRLKPTFIS